jgi:endogenous inhibitor of DNA gyrase (YacG/DUF329 family)
MTDKVKRRHRLYERRSRAGQCAHCAHRFQPDEPVWRLCQRLGQGFYGTIVVPLCAACWPKASTWPADEFSGPITHEWVTYSGNCVACGRPVHQTDWRRVRHHYCSDRCRNAHSPGYQAGLARQARAEARGPSRPCSECGEHFEPRRSDARFCSPRCKQKAYRKRVTDNNSAAGRVIDSRNDNSVTDNNSAVDGLIDSRNEAA